MQSSHLMQLINIKKKLVGLGRLELPTSRLSGVRSNHLSYRPQSIETTDETVGNKYKKRVLKTTTRQEHAIHR